MCIHTHTHKDTYTYTQANLASFLTAQEPVSTVSGWGDVVKSNGALRLSLPNSSSLKLNFIEMQRGMYPDAKFDILWTDTWQNALSHVVGRLPCCPVSPPPLLSRVSLSSLSLSLSLSVVGLVGRVPVSASVRVRVRVCVCICVEVGK